MEGEMDSFTDLSPENLPVPYTGMRTTQYNDTRNDEQQAQYGIGAGGVDLTALAAAVLAAAEANPIPCQRGREVNSPRLMVMGTEADPWGAVGEQLV